MGIFSFFSKSPQKLEEKGDIYFTSDKFGLAKLEYEAALKLIEKKHPDDTILKEKVLDKLKNSKESLARQHLKTGDELVEVDVLDEAKTLFSIALSLTEDPELKKTLIERCNSYDIEILDGEGNDASTPVKEPAPRSFGNNNSDHSFEILCATLPEETAQAYSSYGEHFKEGYIALSNEDFATAAEKLQQAMADCPATNSLIPIELATALTHLDQSEQAIGLLTLYIQDNPSSIHGISLLCEIFCDLKQFDLAHDVIDRSPQNIRETLGGVLNKGRIYFLENNYQMAETSYRSALDSIGWNDDIARELAMTLNAAGRKEESINIYSELLNKCAGCGQRPNPLDLKAFADLSFEMDDFSEKTLKLYLDLADNHPSIRSDCFYKASMIYHNTGNEEEFKRFQQLAEATE